jgi:hypothetical protein
MPDRARAPVTAVSGRCSVLEPHRMGATPLIPDGQRIHVRNRQDV